MWLWDQFWGGGRTHFFSGSDCALEQAAQEWWHLCAWRSLKSIWDTLLGTQLWRCLSRGRSDRIDLGGPVQPPPSCVSVICGVQSHTACPALTHVQCLALLHVPLPNLSVLASAVPPRAVVGQWGIALQDLKRSREGNGVDGPQQEGSGSKGEEGLLLCDTAWVFLLEGQALISLDPTTVGTPFLTRVSGSPSLPTGQGRDAGLRGSQLVSEGHCATRVPCAAEQDRVQAARPRSQQGHVEQVPDGCQGEPGALWGWGCSTPCAAMEHCPAGCRHTEPGCCSLHVLRGRINPLGAGAEPAVAAQLCQPPGCPCPLTTASHSADVPQPCMPRRAQVPQPVVRGTPQHQLLLPVSWTAAAFSPFFSTRHFHPNKCFSTPLCSFGKGRRVPACV